MTLRAPLMKYSFSDGVYKDIVFQFQLTFDVHKRRKYVRFEATFVGTKTKINGFASQKINKTIYNCQYNLLE